MNRSVLMIWPSWKERRVASRGAEGLDSFAAALRQRLQQHEFQGGNHSPEFSFPQGFDFLNRFDKERKQRFGKIVHSPRDGERERAQYSGEWMAHWLFELAAALPNDFVEARTSSICVRMSRKLR